MSDAIISTFAGVLFLAMHYTFKGNIKKGELKKSTQNQIRLNIQIKGWFYIALVCFIISTFQWIDFIAEQINN